MKNLFLTLVTIFTTTILFCQKDTSNLVHSVETKEPPTSHSIILKFNLNENTNDELKNKKFSDYLSKSKITKYKKVTNTRDIIYKLTYDSKESLQESLTYFKENIDILYVETDVLGVCHGTSNIVPTDNEYYKQWAFKNNGNIPFTNSKSGSDIEMEKAWKIEQGDSNVVVAIIDSGLKTDHPEFTGRIWKNYLEIPNNGIDDDNNGYTDDVEGWNFVDETNNVGDDSGHGTNIASIIGSNGNNNVGFSGMDWNCKLMILKVLKNDFVYYSDWISSIYYAVDNGANVINMSLGGDTESQLLNDAIQYALDHNVVVIVSMGNNNTDKISYPSNYPGVIAVGSTNPDDSRTSSFFWSQTSGSNYGKHISVVAPGNYIYGLSHENNTDYNKYYGGTSQAAAFVSGLASLLIAQTPGISNTNVKNLIESTSEDNIGGGEDMIGWDTYYGNGRINALDALSVNSEIKYTINQDDLIIYPNPTTSLINVRFPVETENIEIFNSYGDRIFESSNNMKIENQIVIEENGYFFIQISAFGQKVVKKFVVL